MKIQPYLFYEGRCEEALDFYKKALKAEVTMMMRYSDSPEKPDASKLKPGSENKIMHASFTVGGAVVNASDGGCYGKENAPFESFALTIVAGSAAEAEQMFAGLSDGGNVVMPLGKTFFSPQFGMVSDRFGVLWMVMVE